MQTPKSERVPPSRDQLQEGLLATTGIYVTEADLAHAVGESGTVHLRLELKLERGRVRRSRGSCYFERQMDFRG